VKPKKDRHRERCDECEDRFPDPLTHDAVGVTSRLGPNAPDDSSHPTDGHHRLPRFDCNAGTGRAAVPRRRAPRRAPAPPPPAWSATSVPCRPTRSSYLLAHPSRPGQRSPHALPGPQLAVRGALRGRGPAKSGWTMAEYNREADAITPHLSRPGGGGVWRTSTSRIGAASTAGWSVVGNTSSAAERRARHLSAVEGDHRLIAVPNCAKRSGRVAALLSRHPARRLHSCTRIPARSFSSPLRATAEESVPAFGSSVPRHGLNEPSAGGPHRVGDRHGGNEVSVIRAVGRRRDGLQSSDQPILSVCAEYGATGVEPRRPAWESFGSASKTRAVLGIVGLSSVPRAPGALLYPDVLPLESSCLTAWCSALGDPLARKRRIIVGAPHRQRPGAGVRSIRSAASRPVDLPRIRAGSVDIIPSLHGRLRPVAHASPARVVVANLAVTAVLGLYAFHIRIENSLESMSPRATRRSRTTTPRGRSSGATTWGDRRPRRRRVRPSTIEKLRVTDRSRRPPVWRGALSITNVVDPFANVGSQPPPPHIPPTPDEVEAFKAEVAATPLLGKNLIRTTSAARRSPSSQDLTDATVPRLGVRPADHGDPRGEAAPRRSSFRLLAVNPTRRSRPAFPDNGVCIWSLTD